MVLLFYTTYISVDLAHHEIFRAKVGKGGISSENAFITPFINFRILYSQTKEQRLAFQMVHNSL